MGCGSSSGVPPAYMEEYAKRCSAELDIPGTSEEKESQVFTDLVEMSCEAVPEGVVDPEIGADDKLPDEALDAMFGDEPKGKMLDYLKEECEIPGAGEIGEEIHQRVVSQMESIFRHTPAPVVFPKTFKSDLVTKSGTMVDLPFVDDEEQNDILGGVFGAIDVCLPEDLIGQITPDIGKGVFEGIPLPDDIMEKFSNAKETVLEKLVGKMEVPKVPKDILERILNRVWGALESILKCTPFKTIPKERKEQIISEMNNDIDIPMINEDKEAKLFAAFFTVMDICLPDDVVESLAGAEPPSLDRLKEMFSDEKRDDMLEKLKGIDIPMMGEEKEAKLCSDMYTSFKNAIWKSFGYPVDEGSGEGDEPAEEPAVNEYGLTEEETSALKEAFAAADANGSGKLEPSELAGVLAEWNNTSKKKINQELVDSCLEGCDKDDDGLVSFEEYLEALGNAMVEAAGGNA